MTSLNLDFRLSSASCGILWALVARNAEVEEAAGSGKAYEQYIDPMLTRTAVI
jgi:hypothetical protein